eukprot:6192660-Pleurochrysis_carterae.AAC.1
MMGRPFCAGYISSCAPQDESTVLDTHLYRLCPFPQERTARRSCWTPQKQHTLSPDRVCSVSLSTFILNVLVFCALIVGIVFGRGCVGELRCRFQDGARCALWRSAPEFPNRKCSVRKQPATYVLCELCAEICKCIALGACLVQTPSGTAGRTCPFVC